MADFKPGDVFLSGGNTILSDVIQWTTSSPFSHCGIIFAKDDVLHTVEAISVLKLADEYTGTIICGVSVHELQTRLAFNASVDHDDFWRYPLAEPLTDAESDVLTNLAMSMHGKEYNYLSAAAIGVNILLHTHLPLGDDCTCRLFCSELVTLCLQATNRLPPSMIAAQQSPADVANFSCFGNQEKIY